MFVQIEDTHGRVGLGEREFLISPALGSVTMVSVGKMHPPDSKFLAVKKPFDWMSDESFNNLQILAVHYEWFQEMFERMSRDGRETQWRNLCENDHPENQVSLLWNLKKEHNMLSRYNIKLINAKYHY